MKRIRVLHLIGDLSVGGAQAMLHKLLMRADRERFEPSVIELTDRGDGFRSKIRELGIQVTSVGMGRAPGPKSLWKLAQAVRARKPDVISAWMYHSNLMAVLIQPLLERRVPVIFGIRQSLYDLSTEKRATQWVIRAGVKLSDRAARIVYNAQISSEQHEALGYDKSRRVIIPNGFDCDRFKPNPEARERIRR
ncbi:MAG TPA: glycosyltransferase, partial [Planctomycetota bacterium]|nr:glycosyltransferase [Planctomycetota bacterium]